MYQIINPPGGTIQRIANLLNELFLGLLLTEIQGEHIGEIVDVLNVAEFGHPARDHQDEEGDDQWAVLPHQVVGLRAVVLEGQEIRAFPTAHHVHHFFSEHERRAF